jgi:hypothetical protein
MTPTPDSDALLTQILILVQDLRQDVEFYDARLVECEAQGLALQAKIQSVIDRAFPDSDLEGHKSWHEYRQKGRFRRYLIKLLS